VVVGARARAFVEARSKEGNTMLPSVLDIDVQSPTPTLGAPVTDPAGRVVAILARACQATLPVVPAAGAARPPVVVAQPCIPIVVGVPVAPIEEFLAHPSDAPYLGIHGVADTESGSRGVRVVEVAAGSPAENAGLKGGEDRAQADLIVAVDGQPVDSPEQLADVISRHAIGERVKLLLLLGGRFHEAIVTLKAAP
jgi:serine protease Do